MTPAAQDLCGVCLLSVTYLIVVADFASPLEEFPTSVSHLGKRPQTPAVPNPVTNRHLIGLISISSATGYDWTAKFRHLVNQSAVRGAPVGGRRSVGRTPSPGVAGRKPDSRR
jgi:hypothetical protein